MSSLILCHKKKAKTAYTVTQIHRRIYTLEELCYFLCNHLYLVDYTIMNAQFCEWIDEELELAEMAQTLKKIMEANGSLEQFVMAILELSGIYNTAELLKIQGVMEALKNQKPVEKQKYKADSLLESGAVKSAIMVYLDILKNQRDESVDGTFYGKVYACLGAAYGRMFLYEEAARMYEAAFQICEDKSMLQAYLYASKQYMSRNEYSELLARSVIFQEMDGIIETKAEEVKARIQGLQYDDSLEKWKKQYRRISTGEI